MWGLGVDDGVERCRVPRVEHQRPASRQRIVVDSYKGFLVWKKGYCASSLNLAYAGEKAYTGLEWHDESIANSQARGLSFVVDNRLVQV